MTCCGAPKMPAYVVQVRRDSLGSGAARIEKVCVLGENEAAALKLVRTGLQLDDEVLQIVRTMPDEEVQRVGLKPFQVKHLS
jgi:hypothetical protein